MNEKILVFGDEVVDWIDIPRKPDSTGTSKNWRLTPGTIRVATGGGAYLITDVLRELYDKNTVSGPEFIKTHVPGKEKCIQSYARLEEFKEEKNDKKESFWRIKEFMGYDGPEDSIQSYISFEENIHFKTVIIDDAANGIRNSSGTNELLKKLNSFDTVIYKLARPLNPDTPGLWDSVLAKKEEKNFNLIVLLDANDLRNEGAAISHGLSWERFASDVVHFFTYNNHISRFKSFGGWFVVKAGLEGAVILPPNFKTFLNPEGDSPLLIFNTEKGEDDTFDEYRGRGKMTGYFSVFAATIGYMLNESEFSEGELIHAVKKGLDAAVELLKFGFNVDFKESSVQFPVGKIAEKIKSGPAKKFQNALIPVIPQNYSIHKRIWSVAEGLGLSGIVELAEELVEKEIDSGYLKIPSAKFGKLITYDPSEIENFRTVKRLVSEYLDAGVSDRPLSLGVFGKPGSGKSFGVKEVVSSLLSDKTPVRTFNLSEFQSVEELFRAFHVVHDLTRYGTLPLIFFDEFDSKLNDEQCGWLKYFLAPMQDGQFNDGNDIHPIGRAIFVFAGGTKSSYQEFADQVYEPEFWFSKAKGPDFLSRLRGYIDILGVDPAHDKDFLCLIRRATILRQNILSRAKTLGDKSHWLVNDKKEVIIEGSVLHALLKIPGYRNGARSMVAIIESCQLSLSKGLTKASLPPMHILAMHLDTKRFNELVYAPGFRSKIFIPAREKIAEMVHENYRRANKGTKNDIPWNELSAFDQQQNRYQVDCFPDLLDSAGFRLELENNQQPCTLEEEDIESLAEAEHKRWMADKISQGFQYGKERSNYLMTHPDIVEWDVLGEPERKKDIDAVRVIPELLSVSGLVILKN